MSQAQAWRPQHPRSRQILDLARGLDYGQLDEAGLALAMRHGLLGLIAKDSSSGPLLSYARLLARQQVMLEHTRRLMTSLDQAGVRAAILKGPAVALAYRQPGHRTFTDIDLLVPRTQLLAAVEIIQKDSALQPLPPQKPKADKRELLVRDPESGMQFSLDLHWDAFSYSQLGGRSTGGAEEGWAGARRVDDLLGPRWEMPMAASLAFLAAHAVLDHRFRLILFRDLYEMALRSPDWDALIDFSTRHRLRSTGYIAWLIAARALDAPVPAMALDGLRPSGTALKACERLLPRTDLVTFDGHQAHPLNLALVLLHDEFPQRVRLAMRAPKASVTWRKRVQDQGRPPVRPSLTLLVASTQRRGAEVFCDRLADAMKSHSWQTDFVSLSQATGAQVGARPLVSRLLSGRLDLAAVWALRAYLQDHRPQVLLAFGSSTLRYTAIASRLFLRNRPAIAYASIGEPLYWARSFRQRALYRILLRGADLVLTVSAKTGLQLQRLGVMSSKIKVTPIGVPRELLQLDRQARAEEFRVLFVGSLTDEKDPKSAIEAFVLLSVPARMRMLGSGPLLESLQRLAVDLQVADRIEFLGSVDRVEPHLAWADILLLTSRTEGLPAVILEAAAAGVAVVAFDVGGVSEAIEDRVTGRLIPKRSLSAMVEAMDFFAKHRDQVLAMGLAGRQMVSKRFTIDASARGFDAALASLVKRR